MSTKSIITTVAIVVVVGVGAFFGGLKVGKAKSSNTTSVATAATTGTRTGGRTGGTRTGAAGGAGGFGGGVTGQIISMDSSSITVKTQSGSTEIVYFSGTTPITKEATASTSDLATGDNVVVRGTTSSGTVTATNISIVPTLPTPPTGGSASGNAPMMPVQ